MRGGNFLGTAAYPWRKGTVSLLFVQNRIQLKVMQIFLSTQNYFYVKRSCISRNTQYKYVNFKPIKQQSPQLSTIAGMSGPSSFCFFFKMLGGHQPFFVSKPGWIPLLALLSVCNGILRFTSSVTPADLLASSMTPESFSCTYEQALVGLETGIYHA